MNMRVYYCWITALVASYHDGIIAGMAKKGYMVGALSKDGMTLSPGEASSALITINLYHRQNVDIEIDKVYKDVSDVLDEMKARYFSIIISLATESRWYGSNFNIISVPAPDLTSKKSMN